MSTGAFNGGFSIGEVGLHADTIALLNAMTIRPPQKRIIAIDRLIKTLCIQLNLKSLSATIDYFYCCSAHDQQAANLNWATPGSFTLVNNGALWIADQGYIGNNIGYLETNWNAATNGVNFLQNNAMYGVYQLTDIDSGFISHFTMGAAGLAGANGRQINQKLSSNATAIRMNATTSASPTTTSRKGLYVQARTSSVLTTFFQNGVQLSTSSIASTGLASFSDNLLGCNVNGLPNTTICDSGNTFAFFMASAGYANVARQMIFYRAMNEYLREIGSINNF